MRYDQTNILSSRCQYIVCLFIGVCFERSACSFVVILWMWHCAFVLHLQCLFTLSEHSTVYHHGIKQYVLTHTETSDEGPNRSVVDNVSACQRKVNVFVLADFTATLSFLSVQSTLGSSSGSSMPIRTSQFSYQPVLVIWLNVIRGVCMNQLRRHACVYPKQTLGLVLKHLWIWEQGEQQPGSSAEVFTWLMGGRG